MTNDDPAALAEPIPHLGLFHRLFDKLFPLIRFWHEKVRRNEWYSQIAPDLWLGGAPVTAADYTRIVDSGITAVLNIRAEREDETAFFDRHGITHLQVRVPDVTVPEPARITEGVDWMRDQIEDGRVVLVHCAKGRGRSATLLAGYLMRERGYTFDDAKELLDRKRRLTKLEAKHEAVLEAWLRGDPEPSA